MLFVDTIEAPGLGNRSHLAGGERTAAAVDPPRDVDRVIAAAALHGVRISHVVEAHVHNDYVTGGLEPARLTGAAYLVPAGARVSFERTPVHDGDVTALDAGLTLRALTTTGWRRSPSWPGARGRVPSSWTSGVGRSGRAGSSRARYTFRSTLCTAASTRYRTARCGCTARAACAPVSPPPWLDAAGRTVVAVDDSFDAAEKAGLAVRAT